MHSISKRHKESVAVILAMNLVLLPIWLAVSAGGLAFPNADAVPVPFRFSASLSSPGPLQSDAGPAKGRFLVASRRLRDPNFSETVVLLIDYDRQGAMGLVINRPSGVKLSTMLPDIEELQQRSDVVYLGGPVGRSHILMLIRSSDPPEGSYPVFEDIYVSSSHIVLQRMIDSKTQQERFRVFAGYAGWAAGQLDHEISRGDWHVLQADGESIFDNDPSEIWPELIRQIPVLVVRRYKPFGGAYP